MKHICYLGFFVILFLICGCRSKKGTREDVILLYEQGKRWEEAFQDDSAVAYYLHSFKLAKELKEDSLIGKIGNILGDVLLKQYFYNQAISIHHEAYLHNKKLKDKTAASHSLRGLGKDYMFDISRDSVLYQVKLDSALFYFNRAKKLVTQINDKEEIALVYNNLCVYHIEKKDFLKALEYNQKAIYFTKDSITLYRNYICRGEIYNLISQSDSSIYYCKRALQSSNLYTQHAAYHQLAKTFAQIGSADSAIYLKKTFEIHGLVERQNRKEEILQLFQDSVKEHMYDEKKIILWRIVILILVSTIIVIGLFIKYRRYRKSAQIEKESIIREKENLDKRLFSLEKRLNNKDLEQKRIEQDFIEKEKECTELQKNKDEIIHQKEELSGRLFLLEEKLQCRDSEQKKIEQEFLEKEKECIELQKIKVDIIQQKENLSIRLILLEEKLQNKDSEQKKIEKDFLEKEEECVELKKIKADIIQQKEILNKRLYSLEDKLQSRNTEQKKMKKELLKKEKKCAELQKINEEVLAYNMAEKQLLELISQKENLGKEKIRLSHKRYQQKSVSSYLKSQDQIDFFELMQECFSEYIQILENRFELKERESIICCLIQLGFTKQECANCIKVSLGAYYTIVSRLKTKIEHKFTLKEEISFLLLKEKG